MNGSVMSLKLMNIDKDRDGIIDTADDLPLLCKIRKVK